MEPVPDWSALLSELLSEIAAKLTLIEDFTAFRGVCTSWRAAGTQVKSVFKVPLLMLSEREGDGDVREFYSLSKKRIVSRIPVPQARGKRCLGVGFGWIMTVATSGGELNLVKAMSSSKIQLPNVKTFPEYERYRTWKEQNFMRYAVLTANPSETSDFMLLVVASLNLGFWRNGDSHWTKLEITGRPCFANIGYYKHKMYAIDYGGPRNVWMWDPYDTQPPQVIFSLHEGWTQYMHLAYFVESSKGDLLLVIRDSIHQSDDPEDYEMDFNILQIDTVNEALLRITSLGQDALFVGTDKAVAVIADDFPGVIEANCIYFTDSDFAHSDGSSDMGIYNVEADCVIERFGVESSNSEICLPFWIFPSL